MGAERRAVKEKRGTANGGLGEDTLELIERLDRDRAYYDLKAHSKTLHR